MADLGELVLRLRVDDGAYRREIQAAERLARNFDSQFGNLTSNLRVNIDTQSSSRVLRGFVSSSSTLLINGFRGITNQISRLFTNAFRAIASIPGTIFRGALLEIGAIATNTLGSALRNLADIPGQAVRTFVDFESGLNQLSVVTRQSRDELSGVTDEIRRLGIETSKAPADVIAAANSLATLGLNAEQIQGALASVVALSEATGADLELSAELIAKTGTVFGESFEDAANAITVLRNTSAALPQDVTFLLQNAGSVAANVGIEFNELAAAFATLRDTGVNARPAATGLRNVLQNISPTTDTATAALKELGLTLVDAQTGEFLGFDSFISQLEGSRQRFIDSGKGLEEFNKQLTVLFGKQGVTAALSLLQQADGAFLKNQQSLSNIGGAATDSAQGLQQGLAGALALLQGTVDTLRISLGEALAPALEAFARILTTVGNAILSSEGLFQPLINVTEQLRDTLLSGGFDDSIENLAKAFVELARSGIQQIAILFDRIAGNPDNLARSFTFLTDVISAVPNFVSSVFSSLRGFVEVVVDASRALAPLVSVLINFAGSALRRLPALFAAATNGATPLGRAVGFLENVFNALPGIISTSFAGLQQFVDVAGRVIVALNPLGALLARVGLAALDVFGPLIAQSIDPFIGLLNRASIELVNLFNQIGAFVTGGGLSGVFEPLQASFNNLLLLFGGLRANLTQLGASFGSFLLVALEEFAQTIQIVTGALANNQGLFQGLIDGLTSLFSFLAQNGSQFSDVFQIALNAVTALRDALGGVIQFFRDQDFSDTVATLREAFVGLLTSFAELRASLTGSNIEAQELGTSLGDLAVAVIRELGESLAFVINLLSNFLTLLAENPEGIRALFEGVQLAINGVVLVIDAATESVSLFTEGWMLVAEAIAIATEQVKNFGAFVADLPTAFLNPAAAAGNVVSGLIPRRHGGPVGPGGTYLVGEAGSEIGKFAGQSILFSGPTILPSPPPGKIFNASRTQKMLNTGSPQSNGGAMAELREELAEIRRLLAREFRPQLGERFRNAN